MNHVTDPFIRTVCKDNYYSICLPYAAEPAENVKIFSVVGRDESSRNIYLQEEATIQAGVPYLFRCNGRKALFFRKDASSEDLETPVKGQPLVGTFTASPLMDRKALVILGNEWYHVTNHVSVASNSAWLLLSRLDVKTSPICLHVNERYIG